MRESGKMVAGVAVCSVRCCRRRASCCTVVVSSLRVDGCEMVRRRRGSRGVESVGGVGRVSVADDVDRLGASRGRCSVVGEEW